MNTLKDSMPISIGIPFFNAEAYLADAIRSVFAQTYQEWELILVDDGSKDRSLEIAMSVRDPRVRVISDGQNRRLPYRLNQISSEAKYELVGRMDADDLISPRRFEMQAGILNVHPNIDLVTTGMYSITYDNRPVGMRCSSPDAVITGRGLLLGQCAIVHGSILGRRSWFLRNRYDASLNRAQDFELWLRAFSHNDFKLYVMSEPLYYYREEENVTLKKILAAYKYGPEWLSKYGYLGFNKFELYLYIARMYCKSSIVRFLDVTHNLDILLKRRNMGLNEAQTNLARGEIDQIMQTRVSGLD
jgi:glycosyltransferase involved in cell wall biosynthesis